MNNIQDILVPPEFKGKQTALNSSREYNKREEAQNAFTRACKRILNPGVWHELCGALSPTFTLVDEHGQELNRLAQPGDYIKIKLPAPGNAAGDGYDWVMVDVIEDRSTPNMEKEEFGFRIRASSNPKDKNEETAHFFEDSATGTYIVKREGNIVTALYFGRNEVANTDTDKITDNIRNAIVASVGLIGVSEAQWKTFINRLLEPEIGG
ncbi:hypothetical protein [Gynurincola endophyticus]|uniref:hypothetical protein n=1 Tax=Gynurincola endophyticus TaxID=2479004 RepID=UPI000F8CB1FC|nr:hypothetical protein [Gynurincola endophyticus]